MKTRDKGVSFQIAELRKKIDIYFNLIKRNLNDSIPKVIGFFLIKSIQVEYNEDIMILYYFFILA